jgi:Mrp family chromosome partitioning ATPase
VVDAGRAPLGHTWLLPLAAGLLDSISSRQARALLVEVDPSGNGIAQMLGIDATFHSVDGASDTAAFSNTYHPQIEILRLSVNSPAAVTTRLEESWTELQESYNLILVASGPLAGDTNSRGSNPNQIARSLLPLADAVILSVEMGSTPVSVASQTAERLKSVGANLLGCIVQAAAAAD